jgi:hypothetical protein
MPANLTFVPRDPNDIDLAKRFTRACLKVGLLREIKPRRFREALDETEAQERGGPSKAGEDCSAPRSRRGRSAAAPRDKGVARAEAGRGSVG